MYYKRKPETVRAIQYTNNFKEILEFISGIQSKAYGPVPLDAFELLPHNPNEHKSVVVTVGPPGAYMVHVNKGNFLIVDANGFISVSSERLFLDRYEVA